MKTIQEQLAERIYEILPHKKELEFGCEFIDTDRNFQKKKYTVVYRNNVYNEFGFGKNEVWSVPDYSDGYVADYTIPDEDIIGQPLRLAELLLTIETVINNRSNENWIPKEWIFRNVATKYNLSQDNILSQSDELCKWALELLSDKN